jgi:D-arabinose 5-phosphate isomerase GutQ
MNTTAKAVLAEIDAIFEAAPDLPERLATLLMAPRVLLYGQGRTGLCLRALTMRLAQMGRDAHWLADTAPAPLRPGDLFLANAARGDLPSAVATLAKARSLGAHTAVITAAKEGPALAHADEVLHLPAQTWDGASVLPLGGQYEMALWLLGDLAIDILMARLAVSPERLAAGHVNVG